MFCPLSVQGGQGIGEIDGGMFADKDKCRASGLALFKGRMHETEVTNKL